MYHPQFHPKVDKDLSKFDKGLRREIRDKHIPKILQSPQASGKNLSGKLEGLKSYNFTVNRVGYRIIYDILDETVVVLFLMAGTRENIYDRLVRRLNI